ncbi:NADH pyrophosphatase [Rhodotorula toruloides]
MENYYAGNPLNRLSYLRSSQAFLTSALRSPKAKVLPLDSLSPLCKHDKDGARHLHFVGWKDVEAVVGEAEQVFAGVDGKRDEDVPELAVLGLQAKRLGKTRVGDLSHDEKMRYFLDQPALVFLGVDERSAPESAKSLPVSKPDEHSTLETHSPYGEPYWALDVSALPDLKEKILHENEGAKFMELRSGAQTMPTQEASIAAEARALVDWNTRNKFCPACARPIRSVWAGWKRSCIPGEPSADGVDGQATACISRKGVHNFSYPRTDPVVIMAVLSPDGEKILLGRQRTWPARFYSCLAGFLEAGESLEEAVRREVYEEAGIVVGDVGYHSSQPWPFPASLMFGCWGVAKTEEIRVDLDNELDDARFFTREQVLKVIQSTKPMQLSREQVARLDGKEGASSDKHDLADAKKKADDEGSFLMPPATAIANTLVTAWATGKLFNQAPASVSKM